MRLARESAGMNIETAALKVRTALPNGVRFSRETLRRYETGQVPEWLASFAILRVLAEVYRCELDEVAPRLENLSDLPGDASGWASVIPA